GHENFTLIEYDITKPIRDLFRKKVDYIFHVAGIEQARLTKRTILETLLVNTHGTRNLLEKALADKAKFMLVSTLEHENQVTEDMDSPQARLFSENLTKEYSKHFGVDARIARVGHLFGPRMPLDADSPMSAIIKEIVTKKELILANDQFTRIYPLYVQDVITSLLDIMFGAGTKGKVFNLLPSQSVTLFELSQVLRVVDSQLAVKFDKGGTYIHAFS